MSVWLPGAPCTPRACLEATGASAVSVARGVLRVTAVVALILIGVVLSPFGPRIPATAVRRWCVWTVRAAGVRVRITGRAAPTGGLLLVANHISWLDIPLLAAVRPARMLAKREIRQWPVAGALAARGAVFIDRDRLRTLPATVAQLAEVLRSGAAVGVFPEGSTWCGRAQGRFRRAAFQAALDADVPVQPVRIRYRLPDGTPTTRPAFIGDDSLLTSVWRVATTRHVIAEVDVRPSIAPGSHPDRRSLTRAAEHGTVGGGPTARLHTEPPRPTRTPEGHPADGSRARYASRR
jgi:1-acyl-sn-glycerol-3-phosphate acyltransferase